MGDLNGPSAATLLMHAIVQSQRDHEPLDVTAEMVSLLRRHYPQEYQVFRNVMEEVHRAEHG